jgi:hypothetical protein
LSGIADFTKAEADVPAFRTNSPLRETLVTRRAEPPNIHLEPQLRFVVLETCVLSELSDESKLTQSRVCTSRIMCTSRRVRSLR